MNCELATEVELLDTCQFLSVSKLQLLWRLKPPRPLRTAPASHSQKHLAPMRLKWRRVPAAFTSPVVDATKTESSNRQPGCRHAFPTSRPPPPSQSTFVPGHAAPAPATRRPPESHLQRPPRPHFVSYSEATK